MPERWRWAGPSSAVRWSVVPWSAAPSCSRWWSSGGRARRRGGSRSIAAVGGPVDRDHDAQSDQHEHRRRHPPPTLVRRPRDRGLVGWPGRGRGPWRPARASATPAAGGSAPPRCVRAARRASRRPTRSGPPGASPWLSTATYADRGVGRPRAASRSRERRRAGGRRRRQRCRRRRASPRRASRRARRRWRTGRSPVSLVRRRLFGDEVPGRADERPVSRHVRPQLVEPPCDPEVGELDGAVGPSSTLPGLTSRWTIPAAWAAPSTSRTSP